MKTEIDLKEEFKNLCLQLESFENQLYHTFDLKTKDELRKKMFHIKKWIDEILDQYNKGEL